MLTHVFAIKSYKNLLAYSMGGHIDAIVGAFFEHNSMDVSFVIYNIFCLCELREYRIKKKTFKKWRVFTKAGRQIFFLIVARIK